MKNICAWCKKELGETAAEMEMSNFQVTHGICQSCKDYFFSNKTNTLDEFLNKLDTPVLMVNDKGDVLLANNNALRILKKDITVVKDYRIGNVMECAWAKLPEGCGHTVHCVACTLRSNIDSTFKTGKSLDRVPAVLHRTNEDIQRTDFLISTEKMNNVVLLRIDEIMSEETVVTL